MPKPSDWIFFARNDLNASKLLINSDISLAIVFYHCQQSAEKSLKGYLVYKGERVKRTHDLVDLLNTCVLFDQEFRLLAEDVYDLNPFSSSTRYPEDAFLLPDMTTAHVCIKKAEKILDFVQQKITAKY